jgi:hypothetical protein
VLFFWIVVSFAFGEYAEKNLAETKTPVPNTSVIISGLLFLQDFSAL